MLDSTSISPVDWHPDYTKLFMWRQGQLQKFRTNPELVTAAKAYYKDHPVEFICDWVDTYDPRNAGKEGLMTRMPFLMFPRQKDMVEFLLALLNGEEDGLIEKCRDAGATWVCVAFSVWLWLFWDGISVGWGSRKELLVDKLGVMDSIFEKIRSVIRGLPAQFLPEGFSDKDHMTYMRILNPENDSTIVGEAGTNIGRGGRTRIYFKDESAHYERPEMIEAALGDNTRVQVDISSVNGTGNVFHRRREAGEEWTGGKAIPDKTNVFIFDWSHHPHKTQDWYDKRRAKAIEDGLLHIFAQEVDRDYSSAVDGIIIKPEWIKAAVDAHEKLGFSDDGGWVGGLDVADEGNDKCAFAQRKGVVLRTAEDWGQSDTGVTTRKAIKLSQETGNKNIQYDCIGIGAGVKGEANRIKNEKKMPAGMVFHPWGAGDAVLFPDENIIRGDKNTPTNKDHYANLKAQAWWKLSERFYKTYRAVEEGVDYPSDELISIDSSIPKLQTLKKELAQATSSLSSAKMKLIVNKAPEGTRSPNLADAVVMAYWPVQKSRYTLDNV